MDKQHLKAEREALKADIRRLKGGKKSNAQGSNQSSESEDELANTIASNFSIALGKSQSIQIFYIDVNLCFFNRR